MGNSLARTLTDDIDVATFRVKIRRGLEAMTAQPNPGRKRELHVSDFTASEKQFCARKLVLRYFRGEDKARGASWVMLDGKWREEKWKRVFEACGIMRDYQAELRLGPLVGHPDFLVDYGRGDTILELTGHDSKIDAFLRSVRVAIKKRQALTYLIMRVHTVKGSRRRALVVVEDKGNNEFQVIPVDYNEEMAKMMIGRVVDVSRWIKRIDAAGNDREAVFKQIPKCEKKKCQWCGR